MEQSITARNNAGYLWLSIAFSVVLPMLLGLILSSNLPDWRWTHYPAHSMVESLGSLSSLIIATLMILMVNNSHLPRYYIWIACALIGMGILDGFHALLHAGTSFVWLHSIATMIGGLTFMAVWLPDSTLTASRQKQLLTTVVVSTLIIGVFSISFPTYLPAMVVSGHFSTFAQILNISGGIGFLIGTSFFIHHHLKISRTQLAKSHKGEDIVFANHALLFGIAGLLFEFSVIWDAGWWWWHILRLLAYLVVLIYFLTLFKEQQDILTKNEISLNDTNKHLEQRVYQRTKELEKASQAKTEFLSRMSHELRTPMNAILGFSQLLELDESLQNNHKKSVNEISFAGQHLLELINEILDLTQIDAGKLDVSLEDTNISKIITDSISTMSSVAQQDNIEIINNIQPGIDYIVKVDPLRFKQVIINLLSNAIKYNRKNGQVFISMAVTNHDAIRILVEDTGHGISKEKQTKLFIPFERLDFKGNVVEGAGIGLVLCKKLMKLMHGTIGMYSAPEQGSTFYIEFPYNQ